MMAHTISSDEEIEMIGLTKGLEEDEDEEAESVWPQVKSIVTEASSVVVVMINAAN